MKKLVFAALLGLSALPLSGCAPLVATGVGAGALIAEDRRTTGTYLLDEEIEQKAASRIRDATIGSTHVNVTSYNRRVLLTGEAPDAATRTKLDEVVRGVPNVRDVQNEAAVGESSGFLARSNDSYITAKVKTRLIDDKRVNAHQVKVVTEAKTVFLMGLVKREEAAAAAEIAARTTGVSRVVKIFEYID